MSRPAKARVDARKVNDELARRPEGKSLVVDCALDEVSNVCGLCKGAYRLSEHLVNEHVTPLSQWPTSLRRL